MTMLLTDSGDHEVKASDGLWMSAEDAKTYGLVGRIITSAAELG